MIATSTHKHDYSWFEVLIKSGTEYYRMLLQARDCIQLLDLAVINFHDFHLWLVSSCLVYLSQLEYFAGTFPGRQSCLVNTKL